MRHPGAARETDGVSPVIGVVLLVGIAVTLMGALGVFVLGFGPGGTMPHGEFLFAEESSGPGVEITVASGEDLLEQDIVILIGTERACDGGSPAWDGSGALEPADSVTIDSYGPSCSTTLGSGDLIRVVWESPTSSRQEILAEWEVP